MLTNLLTRFTASVRPSVAAQDESGLRYEVCPPLDPGPPQSALRRSNRWLDSLSSWWRGAHSHKAAAGNAPDFYLESTQLPDSDTRLCPHVSHAKPRHQTSQSRSAGQLEVARAELSDSLGDVHPDTRRDLQWRIRQALSLREIWHLRPEVFTLISIAHSQREATRRLAGLNRHFPVRAPRSGLSCFDDFEARKRA